MTNTTARRAERRRARRSRWILGIGTSTLIGAAVTVLAITRGGSSADTAATRTGETNSMGMPIIATPGAGSGVAEVDGVTATPSLWALGRVPLNVAVQPNWKLANTGIQAVTLGTPHIQIKFAPNSCSRSSGRSAISCMQRCSPNSTCPSSWRTVPRSAAGGARLSRGWAVLRRWMW